MWGELGIRYASRFGGESRPAYLTRFYVKGAPSPARAYPFPGVF